MNDLTLHDAGRAMHSMASRLWPLNRSLSGDGVRQSLAILKEWLPDLSVHEVPSGSKVLDWIVPDEWNPRAAWIEAPDGRRVVDFAEHNLHLVGYSVPVDAILSLEELQEHLHSLPDQPDAIPYVTSYYAPRWGFCLRHRDRERLIPGSYKVHIDATLRPGSLTYGELLIAGETRQEVLLSTYICHPSMANNELSGPCVTAQLGKWLGSLPRRRYTYRIVFVPETIGAVAYLSLHLEHLKRHVIAGFIVTCVGDERCYSYLPSRNGDTLSDRAARHVLKHTDPAFKQYRYLDRGSDERQYCAPGVDLPIATIMRSKYATYPEYHTSLDDLSFVTERGLADSFMAIRRAIAAIEGNAVPRVTVCGEPQLGRRGLYPTLSTRDSYLAAKAMTDLLAYADGTRSLLDIAELIDVPFWTLAPIHETLLEHGLVENLDRQD